MNIKQNFKDSLDWRNLRLILLFNTGIALLLSFIFINISSMKFLDTIKITAIYSFSIGFSIYFFMSILSFQFKNRILKFLFPVLQIIFSTLIGVFIAILIFMLIYKIPSFRINFSGLISTIFLGLIFGLAGTFIFTIYHLSEERKIKQLELKQEQTKAELRALVSQINPHFLFNTLNSISALIHISPEKADAMVQKLANLFRYSLQSGKNRFVSLRNELEIVRQYLEIEKIRFAERLRFKIEFEPECETASIPPLLLQTLVENSIKHGVSPMIEGGEIFIKAKLKNNNIEILIEDNGKGFPDNPKTIGFGLKAVQNILELQFKKQHQFNINNENGVKIYIKIPYIKFTGKENEISNNNN